MIYIIVEYIIDYLLLIQTSFQVFESVVYEVNKKIQLEGRNLSLLFFLLHQISEEFFGLENGCDEVATIPDTSLSLVTLHCIPGYPW